MQDYDNNVRKCLDDYTQLYSEFEDLLRQHTGHSTVHVLDAKLALTAEAEQAVKQGSAVLVVPCRTPQPLATLRRSLAKTRPAKLGLFLDEADAVWSHLPEEATDQKSQRVAHLYAMFGSLQSLTTVAQVRMAP